ncbi:MAG: proton-conducting transporter membrane subunit [Collinsella sp.]
MGLWLHLDSLSSIFVLLVGIIGFITGVYSISYIKIDIEEGSMPAERAKQYFALFSLFVFTMLLACLSNNMILTWAAVEATTLSTVFLVGIYKNKTALEASWKYAMVCTAGVAFGLFGTLLIYANAADIMPNAHEAAFLTPSCPTPTSSTRCSCASRSRSSSSAWHQGGSVPHAHLAARCALPGSEPGLRAALGRAAKCAML